VHTAKSLLTILVASMVLTAVLSAPPARAATVVADPVARAASLTKTEATVHRQIDRLIRRASAAHRGKWIHKRVIRSDRRVIRLIRGVNGLNRHVLGLADADDATYSALLGLNAQVLHLDRDASRLSRKVLSGQHRGISRKMSVLAGHLRVLDGKVRDRWQEVRTPTPTPTPSPTVTPTPTPTPTGVPAGAFNVMDYGAHVDGVTDDVAFIQAAINACSAAGGGIVYLPAGTYRVGMGHLVISGLGGAIELKNNVHLLGAGAATTIIKCTYTNGASIIAAQNKTNIGVEGLAAYHSGANGQADDLKLYKCTDVTVSGCTFHDSYSGTNFIGCTNVLVSNCLTYSQQNAGFAATEDFTIQTTHSDNVVFSGCEAYNCVSGFRVAGATAYDHPAYASRLNKSSFLNCYAHDCATGFMISWASDATMTDCTTAVIGTNNVLVGGVQRAHLHNCSKAHITRPGDGGLWTHYGASSGIVED
jgi:Pectate lyase superfamily protein